MQHSITKFQSLRVAGLVLFSFIILSCSNENEVTIFGEYVDQGSGISMIVLKSDSTYEEFQGEQGLSNSQFSDPEIKISYPANPKCNGKFKLRSEASGMVITLTPQNSGYPCYESKYLWESNKFRQKSGVTPGSWITYSRKD